MVALPRGVAHGLRAAVTGDAAGLARAASIVAGLAFTTAGYAAGCAAGAIRGPVRGARAPVTPGGLPTAPAGTRRPGERKET
jgi:hypothetical protein